jgi:hypothetical protein
MTRVAPLAALLAGLAMTISMAHAQTATPAAPVNDCLANPDGPSPPDSHWYYHLDRASNQKCWHLRQTGASAGQNETTQPRAAAAPAAQPGAVTAADPPNANAAPATPFDFPARSVGQDVSPPESAPAVMPSVPAVTNGNGAMDRTAGPSLMDSNSAAAPPFREANVLKQVAVDPPAVERVAPPVDDPTHLPALLGTGLALVLIIIGSLAGRLIFRFFRRPRRRVAVDLSSPDWGAAHSDLDASPGIVPAMPGGRDITRAMRDIHDERNELPFGAPRRGVRRQASGGEDPLLARRREQVRQNVREDAHQQGESVGIIEDNVRELLLKLRTELQDRLGPGVKADVRAGGGRPT